MKTNLDFKNLFYIFANKKSCLKNWNIDVFQSLRFVKNVTIFKMEKINWSTYVIKIKLSHFFDIGKLFKERLDPFDH